MEKVILIQPPFGNIEAPSVGLSTLKAVLIQNGINTRILYGNLFLAKKISPELYNNISFSLGARLLGEWIFASNAYPSRSNKHEEYERTFLKKKIPIPALKRFLTIRELIKVKNVIDEYLDEFSQIILDLKPKIVGFSNSSHQTCASIALANYLKHDSEIITVLGGFNCTTPMGEALLDISSSIDYIFSGEADFDFLQFCRNVLTNNFPEKRLIECSPILDLNSLPYPDYSDYFEQKQKFRINLERKYNSVWFESSRGCWWGDLSHCIFCGINSGNLKYRSKNPERVKEEIRFLTNKYKADYIQATDSVMPKEFPSVVFGDFEKPSRLKGIFYEVKPFLNFRELAILKKIGIDTLQPGLESLNDHLLIIMKKGLTAANNIRFLRDCGTLNINPEWNILYSIPGDREEDYEEMIELFPQITHLRSPKFAGPLAIPRFSPLYNEFKKYGIRNLRPARSYSYIFPERTDLEKLASIFEGDFDTAFKNQLKREFLSFIKDWQELWENDPPNLHIINLNDEQYIVEDTRPIAKSKVQIIDIEYVQILMKLREPIVEKYVDEFIKVKNLKDQFEELLQWRYIIKINNRFLSLVNEPNRVVNLEKTLE